MTPGPAPLNGPPSRRQTTRLDYRCEALRAAARFYEGKGDGSQSTLDELLEDAARIERWLDR